MDIFYYGNRYFGEDEHPKIKFVIKTSYSSHIIAAE
jgi:hypothetical protein